MCLGRQETSSTACEGMLMKFHLAWNEIQGWRGHLFKLANEHYKRYKSTTLPANAPRGKRHARYHIGYISVSLLAHSGQNWIQSYWRAPVPYTVTIHYHTTSPDQIANNQTVSDQWNNLGMDFLFTVHNLFSPWSFFKHLTKSARSHHINP